MIYHIVFLCCLYFTGTSIIQPRSRQQAPPTHIWPIILCSFLSVRNQCPSAERAGKGRCKPQLLLRSPAAPAADAIALLLAEGRDGHEAHGVGRLSPSTRERQQIPAPMGSLRLQCTWSQPSATGCTEQK